MGGLWSQGSSGLADRSTLLDGGAQSSARPSCRSCTADADMIGCAARRLHFLSLRVNNCHIYTAVISPLTRRSSTSLGIRSRFPLKSLSIRRERQLRRVAHRRALLKRNITDYRVPPTSLSLRVCAAKTVASILPCASPCNACSPRLAITAG